MIAFDKLLAAHLPPPAGRWNGFQPYYFIGGNTDAEIVPIEGLVASGR
jgi:2-aminoadipate transaminase